ncbi:MAG: hypothetical protein N3A57_03735 [Negativicutes bacterium]|nr:hypothetical protein [Negativicutes bacterium]
MIDQTGKPMVDRRGKPYGDEQVGGRMNRHDFTPGNGGRPLAGGGCTGLRAV